MLAHETITERLPVGQSKPIDAAKELVPILELAERLCPEGPRRVGQNLTARCPLPGHDDKTPSFYVYPETGSCWCFGCLRGGDVVNLAAHAWDSAKTRWRWRPRTSSESSATRSRRRPRAGTASSGARSR